MRLRRGIAATSVRGHCSRRWAALLHSRLSPRAAVGPHSAQTFEIIALTGLAPLKTQPAQLRPRIGGEKRLADALERTETGPPLDAGSSCAVANWTPQEKKHFMPPLTRILNPPPQNRGFSRCWTPNSSGAPDSARHPGGPERTRTCPRTGVKPGEGRGLTHGLCRSSCW